MDMDLLWFWEWIWRLEVTDYMKGPIYGIEMYESEMVERLKTFFKCDEIKKKWKSFILSTFWK